MQQADGILSWDMGREFSGAPLRDRRREARLVSVARRISVAPDVGFPAAMGGESELTAFYRFIGSEAVTPDAVLAPHVDQTALRCAQAARVFVVHDTSEVELQGRVKRAGLGPLRSANSQGFLMHVSLAVTADGRRRPLGVLAARTWVREQLGRSRKENGKPRGGSDYIDDAARESTRWWAQIDECEDRLGGVGAIHLFDREGDAYPLLRECLDHEARFVTRMARDRVVVDEDGERIGRATDELVRVGSVLETSVPVAARAKTSSPRMTDGPREARVARLAIGATSMRIAAPNYIDGDPEPLDLNIVYVRELGAPEGVEPIAWVLMTTEPVGTCEQIEAVVEAYRTRWLIEEYFRALKQGCALEKRQLETLHSLTNALAILMPIAAQMLLLRSLARTEPESSAELVLNEVQIQVLRVRVPKMPAHPTVEQALRAVAYLGGHFIKRAPGWIVLGRGFEELLTLEAGWRMALEQRSDRT